jgi:hypothetical protein
MAELHQFVKDLGKKPPVTVSANNLDRNFKISRPMKKGLLGYCKLTITEDGWFCAVPPPPGGTAVLGIVNGGVQWIPTQDCD